MEPTVCSEMLAVGSKGSAEVVSRVHSRWLGWVDWSSGRFWI